jgi:hypothetical protein
MVTGDDADLPAGLLNEPGIIGGARTGYVGVGPGVRVGVGVNQHLTQEPLRGLYAAKSLTIRSVQHPAPGVDHLDGVGNRQSWDDSGMSLAHRLNHPGEQIRRRQTPCDVVHQQNAIIVAQSRQPRSDRRGPIHASDHDLHGDIGRDSNADLTSQETGFGPALLDMGGGRHDDHVTHLTTPKNAAKRVGQ